MTIKTDVLVCGAGCAGLAAALSAARKGANVLLIERAPFAGGIITCVGLPSFDGIAEPIHRRVLTRGIPIELLSKMGGCAADATVVAKYYPQINSVERFKHLADKLILAEAPRLKVLYHTFACGVKMNGNRIAAVQIANKDGLSDIEARIVIDSSGDGDIAAWSGAPLLHNPELQPMTMHWRVGNVDAAAGGLDRLQELCMAAHDAGELPFFYNPGWGNHFAENEFDFHTTRIPADGRDAADLTRAEIQGRNDVWAIFNRFKENIPAFKNSYLIATGPYIGVRETRRIDGQYVLTEQDIAVTRSFDDAIATGVWYLDIHPAKITIASANFGEMIQPTPYDIPYRSLLPRTVENLLVAGRCHSASRMASGSTRVTCTAMALGQAAGYAAALAMSRRADLQELSGVQVRAELDADNVGAVHFPESSSHAPSPALAH